ncbi:hypothetical protein [Pelagibius sp.]|uniref:hypothetical protein n=1 Tax=Pelagibius sp. TaxID=1931238 RepID=UPI003B50D349
MLRGLIYLLSLGALAACVTPPPEEAHTLLDGRLEVALPEAYEPFAWPQRNLRTQSSTSSESEGPEDFILRGGEGALEKKFPNHSYDPAFLSRFLGGGEDIQANIRFVLVELSFANDAQEWTSSENTLGIPRSATDQDLHDRLCESFSAQWSGDRYTVAHFDPESGIGGCVNIIGAFAAQFSRRIDDKLVIAGAMDFVEVLIFEKRGPGKAFFGMTDEEKWDAVKAAANAEVAEQALRSARLR